MKKNVKLIFRVILFVAGLTYLLTGCKCSDDPEINSFVFDELSPPVSGVVNNSAKTIQVTLADSIDKSALVPTITVDPECYTINPASGVPQDFSDVVMYEVENEKGDVAMFQVTVSSGEPSQSLEVVWEEKEPIPDTRGWGPAVVLDGKIYVIGGVLNGEDATAEMLVYDPQSDSWDDTKASMNLPRCCHTASVVNGKIYVMGGFAAAVGNALNSMERYDPETDAWTAFGTLPQKTAAHASAVVNGKIYILGGEPEEPPTEDITYDNLYMYDPQQETWTELASLPEARCWFSASVVNNRIYACGGLNNTSFFVFDDILEYDPANDSWQEMTSMNVTRWEASACTINNRIFIIGGYPTDISGPLSTVEVFDPASNSVMSATKLSKPRSATFVCGFQGKIYVSGGSLNNYPYDNLADLLEVGEPVW